MNSRLKKFILLAVAAVLLVGVGQIQKALNHDRKELGLTRVEPLENAPPVLAFTTVALGGFRGLIANALWIRASDLQDEDKFFEMAQLADWITKLEPHYVQVWLVQGWNMAYNISVKFKDFNDRWRWVERGITLLRDDGLRFNPNETLIYRELAWFFQHKMGQNLDDANMTYKQEWLKEMNTVLGTNEVQFAELFNPQTDEARARYQVLTNKYKLDPAFMKQLDETYGPLEWRLPEAHAIYWAAVGLEKAKEHPTKIKPDDLIQLRRVIYQSMQLSFQRGRLIWDPIVKGFDTGPNLDIIPKVNAAYEQAMEEDAPNRDHIERAHRNFLRDAVYFLYENDRTAEALQWYRYIGEKYPNKNMLDGKPDSLPKNLTMDDYCISRICEDVSETSRDRVKAAIEGQLAKSYFAQVRGEGRRSTGYRALARILRAKYMNAIAGGANAERIGLPTIEETEKQVRDLLLDPERGWPLELRAALRARLNLGPEPTPPAGTNAPPAAAASAK
ncbi:MAG: hypothetical protein U1F83_15280 [Verrucomicrobiota bacterium]